MNNLKYFLNFDKILETAKFEFIFLSLERIFKDDFYDSFMYQII